MNAAAAAAIRIGLDVVARTELNRLLTRPWFLRLSYAPEELRLAERMGAERRLEFLTGRFAAKEAVAKVLGTGLLRGIAPRDICVGRGHGGAPEVTLHGPAAAFAPIAVELSITHKQDVVAAVALGVMPPTESNSPPEPRKEDAHMSLPAPSETADAALLLRVRISQEDAHYGGGLVDGARVLRLFGDLVTEITARCDQDEGLLTEYSNVRFLAPVRPGDYIEARARLVRKTRLRRVVEMEAHKVIEAQPSEHPSAVRVLPTPRLVCTATATTVVPMHAATTKAPATGSGVSTGRLDSPGTASLSAPTAETPTGPASARANAPGKEA